MPRCAITVHIYEIPKYRSWSKINSSPATATTEAAPALLLIKTPFIVVGGPAAGAIRDS